MATRLRVLKYVVQAVLLEEEDGNPVGERETEIVVVYNKDQLNDWLDLVDNTANINEQSSAE